MKKITRCVDCQFLWEEWKHGNISKPICEHPSFNGKPKKTSYYKIPKWCPLGEGGE